MIGLTPLGTSLDHKIIQPLLLGPARSRALQKPLLVIAITDGEVSTHMALCELTLLKGAPAGEPTDKSQCISEGSIRI